MPAASGGPPRPGTEPCGRIAPPGLCQAASFSHWGPDLWGGLHTQETLWSLQGVLREEIT